MQDFTNLTVWKRSHQLALMIYKETRTFPNDERFGLISQMRRAAVSISANIAEGCGRGSDSDFARFLQIGVGSASELQCHLLLSRDLKYLGPEMHDELFSKTGEVKKMLATLLGKLRST